MTPLLGVLVGTAATLLAIVLTVAIVVHRRNRIKRQQHRRQCTGNGGPPIDPAAHVSGGTQALLQQPPSATNRPTGEAGNNGADVHRRTVLLDKTMNGNGYDHIHKFNSLTRPSATIGGHATKDPDIILRDMGEFIIQ